MNLSAGERVGSIVAGLALLKFGNRGAGTRAWSKAVGLSLVARGASGYCPVVEATRGEQSLRDTQAALSGPKGVHVREATTIARPRAEVYQHWRNLERLPELLPHLREVNRVDHRRSRWVDEGALGIPFEWEAELVNEIENEVIAWRSTRSSVVTHAGSVRFSDVPDGTEVLIHIQYRPVAGSLGGLAARLLGHRPHVHVREDLRRVKQLLETGEVPTIEGQPSGRLLHARPWHEVAAS
jgi:uncharacterized membrane protein